MYEVKKRVYASLSKNQKSALCNYLRAFVKKMPELGADEIWQKFYDDEKYYLEMNASRFEFLCDIIDEEDFYNDTILFIRECKKYLDYKKSQGIRFDTPFRKNAHSYWNATMVLRILKNPVYAGILVQGKNTTPSYKVKRRIVKPHGEWDIVQGKHEAVIALDEFKLVQEILALDTRTSPGRSMVELFSGMVYCGECGASMIRKTVPSGKKKYVYYVCAAHKNEKTCFPHSMRDNVLEELVLESLKKQIQNVVGNTRLLEMAEDAVLQKAGICRLQERLDKKQQEIDKYQRLLCSLFESLADGVIDNQEYRQMKRNYDALCLEAKGQADSIRIEMEHMLEICNKKGGWLKQLKKCQNIVKLDRTIVVLLIARILIYRDKQVEIVYNWGDGYRPA